MKKFVFAALALTGCTSLDSDGGLTDDTRGGKHTLTLNWSIKNNDGTPRSCPTGFETLVLSVTESGLNSQVQEVVPCAPTGSKAIPIYTSGDYYWHMDNNTYHESYTPAQDVDVYVTDTDTHTNTYAKSRTKSLTLDADKTVDVEIYPEGGFAHLNWTLQSGNTSMFVTSCATVSVDKISITYQDINDTSAPMYTDTWDCMSVDPADPVLTTHVVGNGVTRALPAGSYSGTGSALRAGTVVATDPDVGFTIEGKNVTVYPGDLDLVVADR